MVKEFGVSRNTVREALRMLEAAGLIKVKQGSRGGAMVTQFIDESASDFLVKAIRLGGISVDHISQLRLGLEPYMAEVLAKKRNINPELISQMEKNILEAKKYIKQMELQSIWI
jgi:GntR family transcriptional repressor for pyruvate dehydrogenase complex